MGEITKIDMESVLARAVDLPYVHIDRDDFLRSELGKYVTDPIVLDTAISLNPAQAGIDKETIDRAARTAIRTETRRITALSTATGMPGGLAMIGTVSVDVTQYIAHVLRVVQKLVYLYGWQDLYNDEGKVDDETKDLLMLFVGTMFGVEGAVKAVTAIAEEMGKQIEKRLLRKALTSTTVYPIVKNVASILGKKMTKEVFAAGVKKGVPIAGGIISGFITFASFRPMANNFKKYLSRLNLCDPDFYS